MIVRPISLRAADTWSWCSLGLALGRKPRSGLGESFAPWSGSAMEFAYGAEAKHVFLLL